MLLLFLLLIASLALAWGLADYVQEQRLNQPLPKPVPVVLKQAPATPTPTVTPPQATLSPATAEGEEQSAELSTEQNANERAPEDDLRSGSTASLPATPAQH